jgi:hypothetical protein
MAVVGPVNMTRTLRTERDDRVTNMWAFAEPALALFVECLESSDRHDVELHEGRVADASLQRIIPFGQMPRMYQSSPIGSSPWSVPKSPEFATIA